MTHATNHRGADLGIALFLALLACPAGAAPRHAEVAALEGTASGTTTVYGLDAAGRRVERVSWKETVTASGLKVTPGRARVEVTLKVSIGKGQPRTTRLVEGYELDEDGSPAAKFYLAGARLVRYRRIAPGMYLRLAPAATELLEQLGFPGSWKPSGHTVSLLSTKIEGGARTDRITQVLSVRWTEKERARSAQFVWMEGVRSYAPAADSKSSAPTHLAIVARMILDLEDLGKHLDQIDDVKSLEREKGGVKRVLGSIAELRAQFRALGRPGPDFRKKVDRKRYLKAIDALVEDVERIGKIQGGQEVIGRLQKVNPYGYGRRHRAVVRKAGKLAHADVAEGMIEVLERLNRQLAAVSEEGVPRHLDRIKKTIAAWEQLRADVQKLGKPSADEAARLARVDAGRFSAAQNGLAAKAQGLARLAGGADVVKMVQDARMLPAAEKKDS